MSYKYRIKEENENKLHTVIAKEGATITFTLADIISAKNRGEKVIKEYKGQSIVHKAELENIKANYPDLFDKDGNLKASEEEIKKAVAIAMYDGAVKQLKKLEDSIESINKAMVEDDAELSKIKEQTGLSIEDGTENK